MAHPFFTHDPLKIPESLPSCCTHVAPDWQEDRSGRLVPVLAEADEAQFRSKDEQKHNAAQLEERHRGKLTPKDVNQRDSNQRYSSQQPAKSSNYRATPNIASNKFEIYDDNKTGPFSQRRKSLAPLPQHDNLVQRNITSSGSEIKSNPMQSPLDDMLCDKMSNCNIQDTPTVAKSSPTLPLSPQDSELLELRVMHERLRNSQQRVETAGGPSNFKPICETDAPGANLWVTRYVDYTSKYGLGFLFNDGR